METTDVIDLRARRLKSMRDRVADWLLETGEATLSEYCDAKRRIRDQVALDARDTPPR
jgi:hypothetical protein